MMAEEAKECIVQINGNYMSCDPEPNNKYLQGGPMKNQIKETEVDEREDVEMSDGPLLSLRLNMDLNATPCAVCGGECEPVGLDFFVAGTKESVCDICAMENDCCIYDDRTEAFRYANLRERWMLQNIRSKIQEVVDESAEKRILKLVNEILDKKLQQEL
jgi:hypothetical protein